jgi:hypothetical protein
VWQNKGSHLGSVFVSDACNLSTKQCQEAFRIRFLTEGSNIKGRNPEDDPKTED